MMRSTTDFFATCLDLENGLSDVEAKYQLKYVRLGSCRTSAVEIYTTAFDIPDLGDEKCTWVLEAKLFLVLHATDEIIIEEREDLDGYRYHEVNYENHPNAIIFCPGGLYKNSCILTGYIHTSRNSDKSILLYQSFRKLIFKRFLPMPNWFKGWKIGPDARHMAENGIRLITMDVNENPSVDARI